MRLMFRSSIAIALTLLAGAAVAQDLAIGVGQKMPTEEEMRGYERRGRAMAEVLVEEAGITPTIVNYAGSDEISRALCAGDVQVGIVQIDAMFVRERSDCVMEIVAEYGDETAFLLVPEDSEITSLAGFTTETKVMTDTAGSGTDLFWRTIVQIEKGFGDSLFDNIDDWVEADQVYGSTDRAAALAEAGRIDVAILVGNPQSPEVLALIDEGWTLGTLRDPNITEEEFNGDELYEITDVEVDVGGWFNVKGTGYEVDSFIVANQAWAAANDPVFREVVAAAKDTAN